MTHRTSIKTLRALVDHLNDLTGNAKEPYTKDEKGKFRANIGNYHLDQAYGGVNLAQMVTEGGGTSCPLGLGYRTKRELASELRAFINGIGTKAA